MSHPKNPKFVLNLKSHFFANHSFLNSNKRKLFLCNTRTSIAANWVFVRTVTSYCDICSKQREAGARCFVGFQNPHVIYKSPAKVN